MLKGSVTFNIYVKESQLERYKSVSHTDYRSHFEVLCSMFWWEVKYVLISMVPTLLQQNIKMVPFVVCIYQYIFYFAINVFLKTNTTSIFQHPHIFFYVMCSNNQFYD